MSKKHSRKLDKQDKEIQPRELDFFFEYDPAYRTVPANGVWGGMTPRGEFLMDFYVEALAVPEQTVEVRSETEFERQKYLFERIPPLYLAQYRGRYVACCDGAVLDHDLSLVELTHRFFAEHGEVPVYITRVEPGQPVLMATPFLR
ncbi:MAG: hypothetical protein V3T83_04825 [Acidobacteriota bacterium]